MDALPGIAERCVNPSEAARPRGLGLPVPPDKE
jgi:hypothetical protein